MDCVQADNRWYGIMFDMGWRACACAILFCDLRSMSLRNVEMLTEALRIINKKLWSSGKSDNIIPGEKNINRRNQ